MCLAKAKPSPSPPWACLRLIHDNRDEAATHPSTPLRVKKGGFHAERRRGTPQSQGLLAEDTPGSPVRDALRQSLGLLTEDA